MENFKNIKWLYLARFASLYGSQLLFFAVPLLVFKLSHNVVYSGAAFSLEWVARLLSFPFSGFIADKFGSKQVYILSDFVISILCCVSILMLAIFNHLSVMIIILLAIFSGFLSEQGYVSAESLAPKLVNVKDYPRSQSILELLELLALLFAPMTAGFFILFFKVPNLIWISAIFFICSAILMRQIITGKVKFDVEISLRKNLSVGLNTIRNEKYLSNLVLLAMIINILFGLMMGAAPVIVIGIYEKPDHFFALLNLCAGLFGILLIISFNYLIKYISIVRMGVATFLLSCFACILLGFCHSYVTYLLLYAFFFGVNSLFSIFFRSERARIIPKEVLGRSIGVIIFITFLLFPLSGVLIGLSKNVFGLSNLIMLSGFICLFLGIPLVLRLYRFNFK